LALGFGWLLGFHVFMSLAPLTVACSRVTAVFFQVSLNFQKKASAAAASLQSKKRPMSG
jgi:hypothetical protein